MKRKSNSFCSMNDSFDCFSTFKALAMTGAVTVQTRVIPRECKICPAMEVACLKEQRDDK